MTTERPRRSKLAQFVADHVFGNQQRHMLPSVVNRDRQTYKFRRNDRPPGPRFDRPSRALFFGPEHLGPQVMVYKRPFSD